MVSKDTIEKELQLLKIDPTKELTIRSVTLKYKEIAKLVHPDRPGGNTNDFQEILIAYRTIIKFIEDNQEGSDNAYDYEAQFFMRNNFMKMCTTSYVVYIQEKLANSWKRVLQRHLAIQKLDDIRVIFKSNNITITLYEHPKKDPRPKIHIQSSDMSKNLDFIVEKLTVFYREVCDTAENAIGIEYHIQERKKSTCNVCGKILVNNKGLRNHITRMHAKSIENDTSKSIAGDLLHVEQSLASRNQIEEGSTFLVVRPSLDLPISPLHKKVRFDKHLDHTDTEKDSTVVEKIILELLDTSTLTSCANDQVESNFQCGENGEISDTVGELESHMSNQHEVINCKQCKELELKNTDLLKQVVRLEEENKDVVDKHDILTRKNVSLDKEVKMLKLALKEIGVEKEQIKKELVDSQETLMKTIKENTVLNDEVKVKNDLIFELMSNEDNTQNEIEVINDEINVEKFKCSKCKFETKDKTTLTRHVIEAHETLVDCRKGCNRKFKSQSSLNDHYKDKHNEKTTPIQTEKEFQCTKCERKFNLQAELIKHCEEVHTFVRITCNICGYVKLSKENMEEHIKAHHTEFKSVRKQICRYFMRGYCVKGASCKFTHVNQHESAGHRQQEHGNLPPECRNGINCRYLRIGVCKFNHHVGNYISHSFGNAQHGDWCYFGNNCIRTHCMYKHPRQVFLQRQQSNHPPIVMRTNVMRNY